ncbi:manganese efflux pump [Aliikangiella marina]|uniref:Putative manganese efflux pump MntP n=1 Tax=Aliikangiella marina TaxID=1712262 RepID=A0A545TJI3_9GAMM|nr:manganese efflux pump MntP family protein [Aliikangiella marina]TQV77336.1 manganese efflux pump [Aliikangiella marina]
MLELIILAIALSLDAFAVSIGLGARHQINPQILAIKSGVYFGVFQGGMPVIGYLGGQGTLAWVETYAPWVAAGLLFLIGMKMIYESYSEGIEQDISQVTPRVMLILAIATSIDAMAAGFALALLGISLTIACILIGLTTFAFSYVGVFIGVKSGTYLESKAEIIGGVILIMIGVKLLIW